MDRDFRACEHFPVERQAPAAFTKGKNRKRKLIRLPRSSEYNSRSSQLSVLNGNEFVNLLQ